MILCVFVLSSRFVELKCYSAECAKKIHSSIAYVVLPGPQVQFIIGMKERLGLIHILHTCHLHS